MKRIMCLVLLCTTSIAFAQKTNFSGSYALDTVRTDFNGGPKWTIPYEVKIDQQNDKMTLTRVNVDQELKKGPAVVDNLTFDNVPFKRVTGSGETLTISLKWLDNSSFLITRNSSAAVIVDNCSLLDGGKTLVIDRSVKQTDGFEYTIKGYYERK